VAESLEPAYEEIKNDLPKQPSLNIDETGWKNQGKNHWLWVFNAPNIAFYHVDSSRGSKVLESILGPVYNGIICSDMFSAYKKYHKNPHQFCWSHIIRSIKGVKRSCRSPDGLKFCKFLLSQISRMFRAWWALKNGYLDRMSFALRSTIVRFHMRICLKRYVKSADEDVRKISKSLLKNWHGLFTFLKNGHVQPTNNSAERALRPAVQWRKICFGNQSDHGLFLTERLLTITRTCILNNINPFQFIIKSIISYRCGTKAPSIV
jgi:transposase